MTLLDCSDRSVYKQHFTVVAFWDGASLNRQNLCKDLNTSSIIAVNKSSVSEMGKSKSYWLLMSVRETEWIQWIQYFSLKM